MDSYTNECFVQKNLANLTECKESFKWDQRDFIYLSEIKETLFIQELEPAFNVNVGSEKLMLY